MKNILFLLIGTIIGFHTLFAQETTIYANDIAVYEKALDLFVKEKYGAAQKQFSLTIEQINNPQSEVSVNATYYAALCALELFNKDAEFLFKQFIINYPESPKIGNAYYHLGRYNFRKKKYERVVYWLSQVDIYDLTNDELSEYYFKLGYSYFMQNDLEKANKMLYEIKDVDTKYSTLANYYYAHIAYTQQHYQTALESFRKAEQHPKFAPIVPYYIAQIYYLQEKYDELIKYAPPLLDSGNTKRAFEIARLIGESYYRTGKYKEAIPFLEKYKKLIRNAPREDIYQLGYAYYKTDDIKKAIATFKEITNKKDNLSQNAFYHIADCYLKQKDYRFARNSFHAAANLDFDPEIAEDALYNYAKLSYQMQFDPYHEAIGAFQDYIKKYPNTPRTDEAYQYLVDVFLTTKNYKDALESLESIKAKDAKLKEAYQKVAFYRAAELFNDRKYVSAIQYYNKSLIYSIDKNMRVNTYYWKGESYYRIKNYDKAIENYTLFAFDPAAFNITDFNLINYQLGYAYFEKKEYSNAITWLRKFVANKAEKDSLKLNDAYLRIGDGFFISNNYYNAIDYYNEAIKIKLLDTDYALYQKSKALSAMKKTEEKIAILETLLAEYGTSNYAVDAKYALAKSYMIQSENEKALALFNDITTNYPTSSYVKESLLNIGQIHFNKKDNETALVVYKRIVNDYPNYEDAKGALKNIRDVYVAMGKVDEYAEYIKGVSFANVSEAALDSTTYEAAELRYMDGDCINAKKDFTSYLNKFKKGIYLLNANFYKAECEYTAKNYEEALASYNFVIQQPLNKFTETALVKASTINYNNKKYDEALANYMMLEKVSEYSNNISEAIIGQMRCFAFLNNYDASMEYADKVLITSKVPEDIKIEAHYIKGKAAYAQDSLPLAIEEFTTTFTSTKNEKGAEAKYIVANIYYMQDSLSKAENMIFDLVTQIPSYDFWIAKGLILLSDVYIAKGDIFQSKHTLQSIIDNYPGEELVKIAQDKLDAIIIAEKQEEEKKMQEENEIKYEEADFYYDQLFEEEVVEE